MDEREEANNDIDIYILAFFGSNKETYNFNIFRMLLNFLSAIYNGEILLIKAEFEQREIEKEIEELQFNYEPKKKKEKKDIDGALMQAKDLLKYRNKIIDAFKDGAFISKHLKESDDAVYDYVLTDVNKFIEKIKLMEEKINVSLFEEFFIKNIKTGDEEKEIVEDIKNRISDLKDKIKKKMSEKEKKIKSRMRH